MKLTTLCLLLLKLFNEACKLFFSVFYFTYLRRHIIGFKSRTLLCAFLEGSYNKEPFIFNVEMLYLATNTFLKYVIISSDKYFVRFFYDDPKHCLCQQTWAFVIIL